MQERLQKILAHAGVASRRKAEEMILQGRVSVNGSTVTELGAKADPEHDVIKADGKKIRIPTRFVYVLLHKPKNVVSTPSAAVSCGTARICGTGRRLPFASR